MEENPLVFKHNEWFYGMNAPNAIVIMIFISFLFLASLGFAAQDRRPVDPPVPTDPPAQPKCPEILRDTTCFSGGTATDAVYAWALSKAGFACDEQMNACYTSQFEELQKNKSYCELFAGCRLKYRAYYDECENGNATNCSGGNDPDPPMFQCTIKGSYNLGGYRCDGVPAVEGEFTA